MPYIVTTKSGTPVGRMYNESGVPFYGYPDVSRRAVATLGEVPAVLDWVPADYDRTWQKIKNLPEQGGTVGPLPDGTVIEVKRITNHELAVYNAAQQKG